jgi:hypothetical protein
VSLFVPKKFRKTGLTGDTKHGFKRMYSCLKQGKIGRKIDKKEAEEKEEDGRSVSVSFSFQFVLEISKNIRKTWENEAPIQANVSKHSCSK